MLHIKLFKLGRLDMYRIMIFVLTQDNEIQDVVFDADNHQFSDTASGMENYGKNSDRIQADQMVKSKIK